MTEIDYDSKYDVLYVALANMENSYGTEDSEGILVHRDMTTKEVTGITIFEFKKRIMGQVDWPIILPESINFERDLEPLIH